MLEHDVMSGRNRKAYIMGGGNTLYSSISDGSAEERFIYTKYLKI